MRVSQALAPGHHPLRPCSLTAVAAPAQVVSLRGPDQSPFPDSGRFYRGFRLYTVPTHPCTHPCSPISGFPDRGPVLLRGSVTGQITCRSAGVIADKVIALRTRHREAAGRRIASADRGAAADQSRARAAGSPSDGLLGARRESRARVGVPNRDGRKGAGAGACRTRCRCSSRSPGGWSSSRSRCAGHDHLGSGERCSGNTPRRAGRYDQRR